MANYLDQIPKQLAARRKAFAAARKNPALLPSCWAIVRSIANNLYEYSRNAVIGGCTFPDRGIHLSVEDSCFINFGATPKLLAQDAAWLEAEQANRPPPEADAPVLPPERADAMGRRLAALARTWGENQQATRVYSLEPWLQDMYRDRLDVDYAENLQRQIDDLNAYMEGVPKALSATGLTGKLAKGVMDAFNLFKTITGSSHQLDREKMSFVDRRNYVNTIQKIELVMAKADESLGSAAAGRSVVRELFGMWKDANYEMMGLTRQLRVLWAGTSLDDRIAELAAMLGALQKTLNRCAEESRMPRPQLPLVRADQEMPNPANRADIEAAFHSVVLHDVVMGANTVLSCREIRRFGPLSVVVAPGEGQPRYCSEMRRLGSGDDEDKRSPTATQTIERESDVDRRVRYPLNCIVVPVAADRDALPVDMAEAWLEFNQAAFPVQYREFLEAVKNAAGDAFLPPPGKEAKDLPATHARQVIAGLAAAFVRWAMSGEEPEEGAPPGFAAYRDLALSRLEPAKFLIPLRYRPLALLFSEAGAKRRIEMWKRCLGPRFALDRQLIAINILQKDWKALRNNLRYLPLSQTKGNSGLDNGFNKLKDNADPFAEHKAMGFFRKFLSEQPDLKAALVAVESAVSIEVETLRTQSESLGRVFQYDQAAETMMRRQASQIQEKRNAANAHIDQYLTGLMYAIDGNLEAAVSALTMCLTPIDKREIDGRPPPETPDIAGQDWFDAHFQPKSGKFAKKTVPGENSAGTVCYDFVYFNLGIVYMRLGRHVEARMCFRGVADAPASGTAHLCKQWAQALFEAEGRKIAPAADTEKA